MKKVLSLLLAWMLMIPTNIYAADQLNAPTNVRWENQTAVWNGVQDDALAGYDLQIKWEQGDQSQTQNASVDKDVTRYDGFASFLAGHPEGKYTFSVTAKSDEEGVQNSQAVWSDPISLVTLQVQSEGGDVLYNGQAVSGALVLPAGTDVVLTPQAEEGYVFKEWENDSETSREETLELILDHATSVQAVFEAKEQPKETTPAKQETAPEPEQEKPVQEEQEQPKQEEPAQTQPAKEEDPVLNTNEVSKVEVKVDFGAGHEAFVQKYFKDFNINGAVVSYTVSSEDAPVTLQEAYWPISNASGRVTQGMDNGELFTDFIALNPISAYASGAQVQEELDTYASTPAESEVQFYALWAAPLDAVELQVTQPLCGTKVKAAGEDTDPAPDVMVVSQHAYVPTDAAPAWVKDADASALFEGTMEGGKSYYADIFLNTDFQYFFTEDATVTINGEPAALVAVQPDGVLETTGSIACAHNWGEWKTTKEPTCTGKGVQERTCQGNSAHKETKELAALGHEWGEWKVTKEATTTQEGQQTRICKRDHAHQETKAIPKKKEEQKKEDKKDQPAQQIVYSLTKGADATWNKGSKDALELVIHRNYEDEKALSHFKGIYVDGKKLSEKAYTVQSGSILLHLKPEFMETLSLGKHTIAVALDDAVDVQTGVNVAVAKAAKKNSTLRTGVQNNMTLYLIPAVLAIGILAFLRKKQS